MSVGEEMVWASWGKGVGTSGSVATRLKGDHGAAFGCADMQTGQHTVTFTIKKTKAGRIFVGLVDASYEDTGCGHGTPHSSDALGLHVAHGCLCRTADPYSYGYGDIEDNEAEPAVKRIVFYVDMDLRELAVSVNGAPPRSTAREIQAKGISLPVALRPWLLFYDYTPSSTGDAVELSYEGPPAPVRIRRDRSRVPGPLVQGQLPPNSFRSSADK